MVSNASTTSRRYAEVLRRAREEGLMTHKDAKRRYAAVVARLNRPRRSPRRGS